MKIYDISQEVFSCCVYPGDRTPEKIAVSRMTDGAKYNLTSLSMCAHNGTHVDAPYHFYRDGKTIDELSPESFIGYAYVALHSGDVSAKDANDIIQKAQDADCRSAMRILIKGDATVTEEAATVFAESGLLLLGNESQTVGPENAPMKTHLILLAKDIVLLEGIRLDAVDEGVYFLNCAPLNLGGCDGAPCRAVLMR